MLFSSLLWYDTGVLSSKVKEEYQESLIAPRGKSFFRKRRVYFQKPFMHLFSLSIKSSTQQKVANLIHYRTSLEVSKQYTPVAVSLSLSRIEKVWQFLSNIFQKKPTFYFFLFSGLLCVLPVESSFASTLPSLTHTFLATAYYSPLPDQTSYYRGSYEADVSLNGSGVAASDGTPVYAGMIAAPSTYSFGTKIYLDGLGIVSVHDR